MRDRLIKLFIIESMKNLKTVDLANWVGKVFIGNRKHIELIQDINSLAKSTGLYLLLGKNLELDETYLYIGEADDVARRIKQHAADKTKDWFEDFIVFVSKDMDLTKAHVRYLEKSLYELANKNLTTIKLKNNSSPTGSNLANYDISYMQEFQDNIIFILNNLGLINFIQTDIQNGYNSKDTTKIFYLTLTQDRKDAEGKIATAKMIITDTGYILLKGSYIESETRPSFKKHSYYKIREKLEKENYFKISDIKGLYQLNEDIPFKSCSAAAAIVKNRSANGRSEWKLKNGQSLDEYEKK